MALREISLRHWPKRLFEEISVGFVNGLVMAVTTAIGIYVWSRSVGPILIIAAATVTDVV